MSWLERLKRPNPPSTTTVIFQRRDRHQPIVFNLQGLREGHALYRVLVVLAQEHYCPQLEPTAEILWQHRGEVWSEELELVFHLRRP